MGCCSVCVYIASENALDGSKGDKRKRGEGEKGIRGFSGGEGRGGEGRTDGRTDGRCWGLAGRRGYVVG